MEYGEGTAPVQFKPDDPNDDRKKVSIRVCVFFDGTLNNRANIEQRLLAKIANPTTGDNDPLTVEEHQRAIRLKEELTTQNDYDKKIKQAQKDYKKYGAPGEDNSYEGYYTNVEKMNRYVANSSDGYDHTLKVYIEGPGTMDLKGDEMPGYAFAMGKSGIPKKVKKGIETVVQRIKSVRGDKGPSIKLITLDVFGFSRGAACARKFIHDALFGGRFVFAGVAGDEVDYLSSIRGQLEDEGYTLSPPGRETGVRVCFAGLYDTVSTYGLGVVGDADDNVSALNLDAVFHADETLHLIAADEHRYHFSVTETRSAGNRGKQYFLPGVHSDVGGGYRDAQDESLPILGSVKFFDNLILQACNPTVKDIENDRARLIAAGWYQDGETRIDNHDYYRDTEGQPAELVERRVMKGHRMGLANAYSRIPLHIMTKSARNKDVPILRKLELEESIPGKVVHNGMTLEDVQKEIQRYIDAKGPYDSIEGDWHDNASDWLRELRHRFFHFSARMVAGHDPRFENGKRTRKHYPHG